MNQQLILNIVRTVTDICVLVGILLLSTCSMDEKSLDCPWFTTQFQHKEPGIEIQYCAKVENDQEIHHGPTKFWVNGKLSFADNWKNNQKHGKSKEWYPNGNIKTEGNYKNGKEDGKWIAWHPNGNKKSEGMYISGKRNGAWISWYEDGKTKMDEVEYDMGKPIGKPLHYDLYGKLMPETSQSERGVEKVGKVVSVDRAKAIPDGKYVYELANGKKSFEETYKSGIKDGPAVYYWHDGNVREKGNYKNGKKDGEWVSIQFGEEYKQIYKDDIPLPPTIPGNIDMKYFEKGHSTFDGTTYSISGDLTSGYTKEINLTQKTIKQSSTLALSLTGNANWAIINTDWSFLIPYENRLFLAIHNSWGWEGAAWDKYEFFILDQKQAKYLGSLIITDRISYDGDDPNETDRCMSRIIKSAEKDKNGIIFKTKRRECDGTFWIPPVCNGVQRIFEDEYLLTEDKLELKKSIPLTVSTPKK
jgi:antitoxin component YwqK of YwqJK toxin-antitoxin module